MEATDDPPASPPMQKQKPEVWKSRHYSRGFVVDRDGTAYLRYSRHWKSTGLRFTPANKAAALKQLDAWLPARITGRASEKPAGKASAPRTVYGLIDEFKALYNAGFTPSQKVSYQKALAAFFPESMPAVPLDFDAILARVEQITATSPLAVGTMLGYRSAVKRLMDHAVRRRYLGSNPVSYAKPVERQPRRGAAVLTRQQVDIVCWWFQCQDMGRDERGRVHNRGRDGGFWRYALLWRLLYYTGMRIGEALRLKWTDYADGFLVIDGKRNAADEPKPRAFPVGSFPEVGGVLEELLKHRGRSVYVLPWWRTDGLPQRELARAIAALGWTPAKDPRGNVTAKRRKLERSPYPPHALRASARFRWLHTLGLSPRTASDLCGHTEEVAQQSYTPEVSGERLAETIARELAR